MTYNIPKHVSGDTWDGINSISFFRNNSAIDLSDAYVEMGVKYTVASPTVLTLSTSNSGITITEPLSGEISIPPIIVNIPPSNYKWYLKLVLETGEIKTYLMGNWPIVANIPQ